MVQEPHHDCYTYALRYIHLYPKTEKELRAKLLEKWYPEKHVDETMQVLKEKKYVDDNVFARLYIESELVKKGKPAYNVQQKLYQKGVDRSIVQHTMQELEEDIWEWTKRKIEKEIEKYKDKWLDGFEIIQKIAGKWYPIASIKRVIRENQ